MLAAPGLLAAKAAADEGEDPRAGAEAGLGTGWGGRVVGASREGSMSRVVHLQTCKTLEAQSLCAGRKQTSQARVDVADDEHFLPHTLQM